MTHPCDEAERRAAVLHYSRSGISLASPSWLLVGDIDAPTHSIELGNELLRDADESLQRTVVAALAERAGNETRWWLTRPGGIEPCPVDLEWHRALRATHASARLVIVTPIGWHEPDTGDQRRWQRIRTLRREDAA